jgi:hypothetical protein
MSEKQYYKYDLSGIMGDSFISLIVGDDSMYYTPKTEVKFSDIPYIEKEGAIASIKQLFQEAGVPESQIIINRFYKEDSHYTCAGNATINISDIIDEKDKRIFGVDRAKGCVRLNFFFSMDDKIYYYINNSESRSLGIFDIKHSTRCIKAKYLFDNSEELTISNGQDLYYGVDLMHWQGQKPITTDKDVIISDIEAKKLKDMDYINDVVMLELGGNLHFRSSFDMDFLEIDANGNDVIAEGDLNIYAIRSANTIKANKLSSYSDLENNYKILCKELYSDNCEFKYALIEDDYLCIRQND